MSLLAYDLVVVGSDPSGRKGAIAAAKAHKRVALVERTVMMGGVCVQIPSKTTREAIFQLTGPTVNAPYGEPNGDISVQDLASRVSAIVSREAEVIRAQLKRNGVTVYQGCAVFLDPHTLEVQGDGEKTELRAENVLVACGA
jgi:NAD(P) transhydrogenase